MRDQQWIPFLYITHDLSTAYQIGDRIFILYQGNVVESGDTVAVIDQPKHPYVQLLIYLVPAPEPDENWREQIDVPDEEETRFSDAIGCRYLGRCPQKTDLCASKAHPETFLCKLTTPSVLPSIRLERVDDLRFASYLVSIN